MGKVTPDQNDPRALLFGVGAAGVVLLLMTFYERRKKANENKGQDSQKAKQNAKKYVKSKVQSKMSKINKLPPEKKKSVMSQIKSAFKRMK